MYRMKLFSIKKNTKVASIMHMQLMLRSNSKYVGGFSYADSIIITKSPGFIHWELDCYMIPDGLGDGAGDRESTYQITVWALFQTEEDAMIAKLSIS